MADLILRPSGIDDPKSAMSLQLRYAHCGGTEYTTLTRMSVSAAVEMVEAGAPYFLFGDPREHGTIKPSDCEFPVFAAFAKERALKLEKDLLEQDNAKAVAYGAGVAARNERIAAINLILGSNPAPLLARIEQEKRDFAAFGAALEKPEPHSWDDWCPVCGKYRNEADKTKCNLADCPRTPEA